MTMTSRRLGAASDGGSTGEPGSSTAESVAQHDRRACTERRPCDDAPSRSSEVPMFDRLLGRAERDPAVADRIPPGQYRTEKFPVLHYGSVPKTDLATWDFRVWGEVDSPFTLTWDDFKALPRTTVATDIHCVTRWSKLDTTWEGVPIQ